jgi:hypothetical protein
LLDSLLALPYNPAVFTEQYLAKPFLVRIAWILFILPVAVTSCSIFGVSELTITWKTESELDIIGFNLLRSESEEGPYMRINDELIPPADDPNVGGEHSYLDRDVVRGTTYYYKLETIGRQGVVTESDPIAITAKR